MSKTGMTSKERLMTVIRGEIPDRVPATVHQWQPYHYRKIMKVRDELEAFLETDLDAVIYPSVSWLKNMVNSQWVIKTTEIPVDENMDEINIEITTPEGVLTGKHMRTEYSSAIIEHTVKRPEDIYLVEKFLPVPEFDIEKVSALNERLGEHGILRCFTNGPQGSPWQDACCFCGTEEMIYHAFDNPDWTHEFMEILLEKKMQYYRKNLAPLKGVFSMIETGGGAASNTVISPSMFEEFCLPYDIRQHNLIHEIDPEIAISYHTCGGMMQILDLIARNGCDFSETLSPPGCGGDIEDYKQEKEVKRSLGAKVKLMGGLNQLQILTEGGREQIYAEVERCFKGYGENGGYIMMPSDHFFHAPRKNLEYYCAAVKELCNY